MQFSPAHASSGHVEEKACPTYKVSDSKQLQVLPQNSLKSPYTRAVHRAPCSSAVSGTLNGDAFYEVFLRTIWTLFRHSSDLFGIVDCILFVLYSILPGIIALRTQQRTTYFSAVCAVRSEQEMKIWPRLTTWIIIALLLFSLKVKKFQRLFAIECRLCNCVQKRGHGQQLKRSARCSRNFFFHPLFTYSQSQLTLIIFVSHFSVGKKVRKIHAKRICWRRVTELEWTTTMTMTSCDILRWTRAKLH